MSTCGLTLSQDNVSEWSNMSVYLWIILNQDTGNVSVEQHVCLPVG